MSYNPLKSRRFWTFIIAQLVGIAPLVIAHYATDPFTVDMAKFGLAFIEGLAGVLIVSYTVDDTASNVTAIRAGTHPDYPPVAPTITMSGPVDPPIIVNRTQ
jgi:hypothetical protein